MIDHPHFVEYNRPHAPSKKQLDFIFEVYQLLFRTGDIPLRTKQVTLETAAVTLYPWRIVCISDKALRAIQRQRTTLGLRRGHPFRRADRAAVLFQRGKALSRAAFKDYFFLHDTVALVEGKENGKHGHAHWSELHPVPEGFFVGGSFSVRLNDADLAWVDERCAAMDIGPTHEKPKRARRAKPAAAHAHGLKQ